MEVCTESPQMALDFEASAKAAELGAMEEKHPDRLAEARNQAKQFALSPLSEQKYGIPYSCTIEDVRELCDIKPDKSGKGRNKWLGAVFNNGEWTDTGMFHRKNRSPGCHYRPLPIWQLMNGYFKSNVGVP